MSIRKNKRRFIKHEAARFIRKSFARILPASFTVYAVCFFPIPIFAKLASFLEDVGAKNAGIISVFLSVTVFSLTSPIVFGYIVFLSRIAGNDGKASCRLLFTYFEDRGSYLRSLRFSVSLLLKGSLCAAAVYASFGLAKRINSDIGIESFIENSIGHTVYLAFAAFVSLVPLIVLFFMLLFSQSFEKRIYVFCSHAPSVSLPKGKMKKHERFGACLFDLSFLPLFLLSLLSFGILTVFYFTPYFIIGKSLYFTVTDM